MSFREHISYLSGFMFYCLYKGTLSKNTEQYLPPAITAGLSLCASCWNTEAGIQKQRSEIGANIFLVASFTSYRAFQKDTMHFPVESLDISGQEWTESVHITV